MRRDEIVYKAPEELIPYEKNNKIHNEKQIKDLVRSIKEMGFRSPILVDENRVILAGHGRAEAISGLIIVLFLAMVAYEIMSGAIVKLINPSLITTPDVYAALMAIFGIFINLIISNYIIKIGKENIGLNYNSRFFLHRIIFYQTRF